MYLEESRGKNKNQNPIGPIEDWCHIIYEVTRKQSVTSTPMHIHTRIQNTLKYT